MAVSKECAHDIEQSRQIISMNLQQKVDFKDLEDVSRKIHVKADVEKV